MTETLTIVWAVIAGLFCLIGVVGIVRRIIRTEAYADEFRHAAEEGVVDSQEFPPEQ
jgi:hypothetical protein